MIIDDEEQIADKVYSACQCHVVHPTSLTMNFTGWSECKN